MSGDHHNGSRRGMRNLATIQTRMMSATPSNRTQAVSRYARLEHERMRIQRELEAWSLRKLEAERALARVDEELSAMRNLLLGTPEATQVAPSRRRNEPKGQAVLRRPPTTSSVIEY